MDLAATTLAAIFPNNRARMLYASNRLDTRHFAQNPHTRALWELAMAYYNRYNDVPTPQVVKELVSKRFEPGEAALVWQMYAGACNNAVSDSEFRFALDGLIDRDNHAKTGEALAIAYEILEKEYTVDGETYKGHDDMRKFLEIRLPEIDRNGLIDAAPEGNVRVETDDILKEYFERKNRQDGQGVLFGIPSIDSPSGGIMVGDLAMIAAYTSHGKSQWCVNTAWDACIKQKKNVYYGTSETSRTDIINRFVARHSRLDKFGHPEGLNHAKIRKGELTPAEEKVFRNVLDDLRSGDYGVFEVQQLERGSTLNHLEHRMLAKHSEWGIDLACVDYLNLLSPTVRRSTQREEASDLIKDAKTLATSFGGSGVPLLTPWQVSRNAWEKAQAAQGYDLTALAEASEAEKSADLVLTLLYDYKLSPKTAVAQLIKCRNGELVPKINLDVDYRCAFLQESGGSGMSSPKVVGTTTGLPGLTTSY